MVAQLSLLEPTESKCDVWYLEQSNAQSSMRVSGEAPSVMATETTQYLPTAAYHIQQARPGNQWPVEQLRSVNLTQMMDDVQLRAIDSDK